MKNALKAKLQTRQTSILTLMTEISNYTVLQTEAELSPEFALVDVPKVVSVLIALTDDKYAERALTWAISNFITPGQTVTLLLVLPSEVPARYNLTSAGEEFFVDEAVSNKEAIEKIAFEHSVPLLHAHRKKIQEAVYGVNVNLVVGIDVLITDYGVACEKIVDFCHTRDVGMLIVGGRKLGAIKR